MYVCISEPAWRCVCMYVLRRWHGGVHVCTYFAVGTEVCMCVCIFEVAWRCVCMSVFLRWHGGVYACTYFAGGTEVCMCVRVRIASSKRACTHIYIHIYLQRHAYIRLYACMRAHTHPHTPIFQGVTSYKATSGLPTFGYATTENPCLPGTYLFLHSM